MIKIFDTPFLGMEFPLFESKEDQEYLLKRALIFSLAFGAIVIAVFTRYCFKQWKLKTEIEIISPKPEVSLLEKEPSPLEKLESRVENFKKRHQSIFNSRKEIWSRYDLVTREVKEKKEGSKEKIDFCLKDLEKLEKLMSETVSEIERLLEKVKKKTWESEEIKEVKGLIKDLFSYVTDLNNWNDICSVWKSNLIEKSKSN